MYMEKLFSQIVYICIDMNVILFILGTSKNIYSNSMQYLKDIKKNI